MQSRLLAHTILFEKQGAPPDLTAPSDLAAVAISDTEIDLTWTDTAPDADGYKIERSPGGAGTWAQIDDIAAPATGYSDSGLNPETEYDYRIRAYVGATNGSYSNTATATTEATPYAGPFDGITFAALYGMKRFLTAYTGNLVRLRRDSDNAESDFGYVAATGLLDTASIATWLGGANGYVVTWYDQSGNGRDATQATATKQPPYTASAINSLPAVSFASTGDDQLQTGNYAHFPSKRGSVIAAFRTNRASNYGVLWTTEQISASGYCKGYITTSGVAYTWYDGVHATAAANESNNTNYIKSLVRTANTTVEHRRNGTLSDTLTVSNNQSDSKALTIGNGDGSESVGAYIAMIAELASAISAANHNTIGNELATLYGISWTTVS